MRRLLRLPLYRAIGAVASATPITRITDVILRTVSRVAVANRHLLVDMTPLEPDGQNGGAGLVATSLVRHLAALAPELQMTLLTAHASHADLAVLDAPNVRRVRVDRRPHSRSLARTLVDTLLPVRTRVQLKRAYWSLKTSREYGRAADDLRPDLLFAPFTVPYFWRPGIPCVSIVYDLQHLTYPEFFSPEQQLNRQRHVADACARSARVVCISDYVRHTLLAHDRLALRGKDFLLYPANFWPHKNHRALFEALQVYRQAHADIDVSLVCTGAPNALMQSLKTLAESLLPSGSVVFAGYLASEELAALFEACQALIFPSLYEGFGMPVLEAMARGKPVLCSNVTSLPEVAGDAAIYFDPTDPRLIAEAINVLGNRETIVELVGRGRKRAETFGDGHRMAMDYLSVFRAVLSASAA
jgi:glycosyltransferase involved in cell wall biosynthesis